MARHERGGSVGLVFAHARNGQADQRRNQIAVNGKKDAQHKKEQRRRAFVFAAAVAAGKPYPKAHFRQKRKERNPRHGDEHQADIAVLDVRKFVCNHAFQFRPFQLQHDAFRQRDGRVFRVPPGGKRV